MKSIVVRPGERPVIEDIGSTLESMQEVVGGDIQQILPWDDDVALICHESGKLLDLPINRLLTDETGRIVDVICGTFFLCYAPLDSEEFLSLPEPLLKKYLDLF